MVVDLVVVVVSCQTPGPRPKIVVDKIDIFSQSVSLTQYVVLSACLFQLAYCLNDQAHIA